MPRILRTVIPRIKKSLREHGVAASLRRSVLLPIHLFREYRHSHALGPTSERSEFDRSFGVETDGELENWTYLSDLDIPSPNWVEGRDYTPIEPERLAMVLSSLRIRHDDFVFVDFGSGKGRALLVASQFPFRKIIGIEFSPQLHAIAVRNLVSYRNPDQRCRDIQCVCLDFTQFPLPPEPLVLFFFDPCDERLLAQVLRNIEVSLRQSPRDVFICYVAPRLRQLMDSARFLEKVSVNEEFQFCVYHGHGT
jgi:SAM-dependent methyltransferase